MNALDQYLLLRIFAPVSAWWGRLTGARVSDQVRALCPAIMPLCLLEDAARGSIAFAVIEAAVFGVMSFAIWKTAPTADSIPNPFSHDVMRQFWLILPVIRVILAPFSVSDSSSLVWWLGLAFELFVVVVLYIRGCPAPPPKRERQPAGAPMLRA